MQCIALTALHGVERASAGFASLAGGQRAVQVVDSPLMEQIEKRTEK
jgi:hypothetical protein